MDLWGISLTWHNYCDIKISNWKFKGFFFFLDSITTLRQKAVPEEIEIGGST